MSLVPRTVVIDPGHGGTGTVGGSDGNHAVSPSGVREKEMTLDLAQLVQRAMAEARSDVRVILTRTGDVNLSLQARANVARDNTADLFLSIHFNGFDGVTRGVEAFVRPVDAGNINHDEDRAFALRVQDGVFNAIRAHDAQTRNRGVKDMRLGVLTDAHLGNTPGHARCRACLLEVEFIDVPAVDRLLNTSADASRVRAEIAAAITASLLASLP